MRHEKTCAKVSIVLNPCTLVTFVRTTIEDPGLCDPLGLKLMLIHGLNNVCFDLEIFTIQFYT